MRVPHGLLVVALLVLSHNLSTIASAQSAKSVTQPWLKGNPKPQWIWTQAEATGGQKLFLRTTFELNSEAVGAILYTTCDNKMSLSINGQEIGKSPDWPQPIIKSISGKQQLKKVFRTGKNCIAIAAENAGGTAAFVFKMEVTLANGEVKTITSDAKWKASETAVGDWKATDFDDSRWNVKLASKGNIGVGPWNVPGFSPSGGSSSPLDPAEITVPPGFKVELVYTVPKEQEGSWVSLTKGRDGKLLASDQGNKGLFEITLGDEVHVEKVPIDLSGAQGLLWAFDGLYFNRNGGHLYKATDSDDDGVLDKVEELPSATGGGEHGNHAVIVTEDEQALYVVAGNHTTLPELSGSRVPTWDEDLLLPRQWDARGHARGRLAPGGWVTRFDPEKKTHELYCIGFRNEYDVALNAHGDMFTFDADMEWDMGMPWYRPTRICQVVSGGDYGWRSGTGKWPTYYEDSLPPVVEIGPGSPTGVVAGLGAKFPAKYQQAIFALDWTFGTIYAIHLEPNGAGYQDESEPFCFGAPLPVTDAVIGDDGAFYFTVGGRGTQSALYRVSYAGDAVTKPASPVVNREAAEARQLRRALEVFHGKEDPQAVDFAWEYLGSDDRFLRHAARIAVESQPVGQWASRVSEESDPQTRITSAVALARMGTEAHHELLVNTLLDTDLKTLTDAQILGLLRAYSLTFIRQGAPTAAERNVVIDHVRPLLPNENSDINVEAIRLLVYLNDARVIEKALALIEQEEQTDIPEWSELISRNAGYGGAIQGMLDNHPPTRKIMYAFLLRNMRQGWTIEQRRTYFEFLNSAAKYQGGASFTGFLTNIREEALGNCTNEERAALADVTGEDFNPVPDFEITPPKGPGRNWTTEEAKRVANRSRFPKASYENGRNLYFATNCGKCHRFAGLGGGVGPDLTSIRNKFDTGYLIESIIEPSKVISDQYAPSMVFLEDGKTVQGLVIEREDKIEVYPPDPKGEPVVVNADEVLEIIPSKISQMPTELINKLNEDELRDLIAYLISGGDPKNRVYGR